VPNSVGLRLPYTTVKAFKANLDEPDLKNPCAPGETGIIVIKGPNVSPGYTAQERNPGTFEDGWLISGDLGSVDADGQIFLTGRAKDVIIRGAHNIDPAMIEEHLEAHPAVEISAAIGQPDAYAGELPIVYVTLKTGQEVTEAQISEYLKKRIAEPPAMPKRVVIIDEMPLTPIGKVFKPNLRARATKYVVLETLAALKQGEVTAVSVSEESSPFTVEISLTGGEAARTEASEMLRNFSFEYSFLD
jgi:fatty-acyl-CoA synthase